MPGSLQSRIRRENGVDVFAQVTGMFDGPSGRFTYASMTSMRLFPRGGVVFQGEKDWIRLTAPFNANVFDVARLELHRPGLEAIVQRWPDARQYKLQVEAFGRSVTGAAYTWPLEEARGNQAMIDAVFAAETPI